MFGRESLFPTLTGGNRGIRSLMELHNQLDQLFDDFVPETRRAFGAAMQPVMTPTFELTETDDHYLLSFDMPGVPKDNLKVEVRDNVLFVTGERDEDWKEDTSAGRDKKKFRSYGRFETALALPVGIESGKIEASCRDGVLRIAIPRTEGTKSRQIKIGEGKEPIWARLIPHRDEKKAKSVDVKEDQAIH